jgi:hypothetical protein
MNQITQPNLSMVRQTVQKHFPALWPAVEACLSACATLLLKDNVNPVTMIIVGPPGTGKTTVTDMFQGATFAGKALCYRTDKFTKASFVSHSAQATEKELKSIDLLPKIQNKVLVTPELSPIFRGKHDELVEIFSIITRVLDGQGLTTDSGTHGRRGYEGEYIFTWLGATTPFDTKAWEVMAQLGSRLFFLVLATEDSATLADLVASLHEDVPYSLALQECKQVVGDFLSDLFRSYNGPRQVEWHWTTNAPCLLERIGRFAMLLAQMRTPYKPDENPLHESPRRANVILYNLARGRALIHGRQVLKQDDLPRVAQIALSSMPSHRRAMWKAMAQNQGQPLTAKQVSQALDVSPNTAQDRMREMAWLGVMVLDSPGQGIASTLNIHPDWKWFVTGEGAQLVLGSTSQNSGVESEPRTLSSISSPEREEDVRKARTP